MTYGQILQYESELQRLNGSVMLYLLRGRVTEFYNEYGLRLKTARMELSELVKKYFELDENGAVRMEGEGEKQTRVLKPGMTMEEYNKEFTAILNRPMLNKM